MASGDRREGRKGLKGWEGAGASLWAQGSLGELVFQVRRGSGDGCSFVPEKRCFRSGCALSPDGTGRKWIPDLSSTRKEGGAVHCLEQTGPRRPPGQRLRNPKVSGITAQNAAEAVRPGPRPPPRNRPAPHTHTHPRSEFPNVWVFVLLYSETVEVTLKLPFLLFR